MLERFRYCSLSTPGQANHQSKFPRVRRVHNVSCFAHRPEDRSMGSDCSREFKSDDDLMKFQKHGFHKLRSLQGVGMTAHVKTASEPIV